MFTRGFYHKELTQEKTTLINMSPAAFMFEIHMLVDSGGAFGLDVDEAWETFELATQTNYANPGIEPKYYSKLEETDPASLAEDKDACLELYDYLSNLIDKLPTYKKRGK